MINVDKLVLIDAQAAGRIQQQRGLPEWDEPTDQDPSDPKYRLIALDLRELAAHQFKQRDPLLLPWLNSQDLAMLFAGRGIGKTHLSLAIAFAVACGSSFGNWHAPRAAKVLYLDGELPGVMDAQL